MVADSPPQIADLLLDSLLWPDNPLGRDVAGTAESVVGHHPRRDARLPRRAVRAEQHRRLRRRQRHARRSGGHRSPRRSATGTPGRPTAWLPASNAQRPPHRRPLQDDRAGARQPGGARHPAQPPGPPRALVPLGDPRRGHVLAAVHGAAGEARPRLRRQQLRLALPGHGRLQRLHRRRPQERRRRRSRWSSPSWSACATTARQRGADEGARAVQGPDDAAHGGHALRQRLDRRAGAAAGLTCARSKTPSPRWTR